ncbi:MAG: hypothetical protein GIKADHBN_02186 [Phycisphaerales bacterium]|nr:hypothetical protein [Phycisphaerales bacterium]
MARLHEYQGKAILSAAGIDVPRGGVARSPKEAADRAGSLAGPTVIKAQAWTTSRAVQGGIAFAATPAESAAHAERMLAARFGNFPVSEVLVEEKLPFARELFVSLAVDERAKAPVLILSGTGGSGVEERAASAHRIACDVNAGPDPTELASAIAALKLDASTASKLNALAARLFSLARSLDARSLEINPLAVTTDGRVVAADCRITIDDYAAARHPELGIEIARELDHPPTELERLAYRIEQADHRGTFFFAQMATVAPEGSRGLIGFHGAGGGGSMMAMDAVSAEGFTVANFCDTSGNPSPAKVYRAARIILSQPGLVGYFGSGSGVASQEQFWSAYGLAKAFWELELSIPAVIRLGGNTEDRAVDILHSVRPFVGAPVEGYKKNDPPARIAARFAELVGARASGTRATDLADSKPVPTWKPRPPRRPAFVDSPGAASFPIKDGTLWIDRDAWRLHGPAIAARSNGLLRDDAGTPVLTVADPELMAKDSDLIACEVECRRDGIDGLFVVLDIPGL